MKNNLLKTEKMMTVVENTIVNGVTKFSTYGSAKHKFRNKFVALFVCMFLFGTANGLAQRIWNVNDWNNFANNPNQFSSWELMADIGPVNQMVAVPFTGSFNGNNLRITANINSNAPNVGLFSELAGGAIYNLVLAGSVIGGSNSQYVGGFAGLISSQSNSYLGLLTNLAEVTGNASFSHVGGIAGAIITESPIGISHFANNGTITGGFAVGGIFGSISTPTALPSHGIQIKILKNAGTIKSNEDATPNYMAGIVGYVDIISEGLAGVYQTTNIGKVLSSKSMYSGGIVAFLTGTNNTFTICHLNSGLVDGATISSGGIVGHLSNSTSIYDCINTNWVAGTAPNSGSIVGFNEDITNSNIASSFYDNQMSVVGAINNVDVLGIAEGIITNDMLGVNLQPLLQYVIWNVWRFQANLYPRLDEWDNHPIDLLSAAPIYLQNGERLDNVQTNFFVSNFNQWIPPWIIPPPYVYQWESFNGNVVNIPLSPSNNVNIVGWT